MTNFSRRYYEREMGALMGLDPGGQESLTGYSEPFRRFIQREQLLAQANEIPNQMPSWLPANDYFLDFHTGDPYVKIPEGYARLPGAGHEALHPEVEGMSPEDYPDLDSRVSTKPHELRGGHQVPASLHALCHPRRAGPINLPQHAKHKGCHGETGNRVPVHCWSVPWRTGISDPAGQQVRPRCGRGVSKCGITRNGSLKGAEWCGTGSWFGLRGLHTRLDCRSG